jgi:methylated-DNA-[protein]-cysteine S-methyltransferase
MPIRTDFAARVLSVVRKIPRGRVATYGEVASAAGRPGAARAVGNIMMHCERPDVPCHRVIAAGGRLGGYGGSEHLKRQLLVAEGVSVRGTRVPMQEFGWRARSAGGRR